MHTCVLQGPSPPRQGFWRLESKRQAPGQPQHVSGGAAAPPRARGRGSGAGAAPGGHKDVPRPAGPCCALAGASSSTTPAAPERLLLLGSSHSLYGRRAAGPCCARPPLAHDGSGGGRPRRSAAARRTAVKASASRQDVAPGSRKQEEEQDLIWQGGTHQQSPRGGGGGGDGDGDGDAVANFGAAVRALREDVPKVCTLLLKHDGRIDALPCVLGGPSRTAAVLLPSVTAWPAAQRPLLPYPLALLCPSRPVTTGVCAHARIS